MYPNGQPPSPSGDDPTDATNGGDRDPTDGIWMTKAQLAAVRRISVASADRLIRRQGWRKHPGNDGRARVLVPADWAISRTSSPMEAPPADPTDDQSERPAASVANPTDTESSPTDITNAISALEAAVSTLREQLAAAMSRADQAEADRGAAIVLADQSVTLAKDAAARADRAEQGRDGERTRADAERTRADGLADQLRVAQVEFAKAEAEGDALAVETAELTAQVKAAQIARAEAEADAAELRRVEAARRGRGRLARVLAAWRGNSDDGR